MQHHRHYQQQQALNQWLFTPQHFLVAPTTLLSKHDLLCSPYEEQFFEWPMMQTDLQQSMQRRAKTNDAAKKFCQQLEFAIPTTYHGHTMNTYFAEHLPGVHHFFQDAEDRECLLCTFCACEEQLVADFVSQLLSHKKMQLRKYRAQKAQQNTAFVGLRLRDRVWILRLE